MEWLITTHCTLPDCTHYLTTLYQPWYVLLSVGDSVPLELSDRPHTQRDAVPQAPLLHKLRLSLALGPVAVVNVYCPHLSAQPAIWSTAQT